MATVFLSGWFIFTIAIMYMKKYELTLSANMVATASMAMYFFIKAEDVAGAMLLIAFFSSFIQLIISYISEKKSHLMLRNLIAATIAIIVCIYKYQGPTDILPCLAFIIVRMGEAQNSAMFMKLGIIGAMVTFLIFGLFTELYYMSALQAVVVIVFAEKTLRDRKKANLVKAA